MAVERTKRTRVVLVIVLVSAGVLAGLLWLLFGGSHSGVLQCYVPEDSMDPMPVCE